jgi:hypothetical protein
MNAYLPGGLWRSATMVMMTRRLVIALAICGAAVGIGIGVLGRGTDAQRKNAAYEEEMKQQVLRCWKSARERCRDACMTQHQAEVDEMYRQLEGMATKGAGDFFTGFGVGHELGTKIHACIETCARVEVESRGAECQML